MNLRPSILLCSADEDSARRIGAAAGDHVNLLRVTSLEEAEENMSLHAPVTVIVDVRCDDLYHRIDEWISRYPDVPVIAMGRARSDRILALERIEVFMCADPEDDYREWQDALRLAMKHHRALAELRGARESGRTVNTPPPPIPAPPAHPAREGPSIITRVTTAFRHFDNLDLMLDRAVEELAAAAHTTRAGLFARDDSGGPYRLRAGLRYLKETASATYDPRDPLVRWFERHAHMVTRTLVSQMPDPAQRQLLTRSLDLAGAEVMVPLHARGQLLGWFFVGYQSTGQSYTLGDLEELSLAADYLSMLLENALLYREVAVQKSLAETLLHALPTGIVAVDGGGIIRWFSTSAEQMFSRSAADVVGKPIEAIGTRLADTVRRAMAGDTPPPPAAWEEFVSRRYLQVEARRLGAARENLGAIAIIQDLTSIRQLQEKQAQMERTAFWNDLAAGLSHEIRNPLVAIRTFAQLLPERYQDEEFRREFSGLVNREVERLDGIIEQINGFANPPAPARNRVDVRQSLKQALARVFPAGSRNPVKIHARLDGNLPLIQGDEQALTECFTHLFRNASEALDGKTDGVIEYAAESRVGTGNQTVVQVTIQDNGRGIPGEFQEKVFSPFYTTKARGMGLGLPIVKRTVIDHSGQVHIDSNGSGTSVVIELPTADQADNGEKT